MNEIIEYLLAHSPYKLKELKLFNQYDHETLYEMYGGQARMFEIFHPKGGRMNMDLTLNHEYEMITVVYSIKIVDVYAKAQNFNNIYAMAKARSTSVGDVIHDVMAGKYYMYHPYDLVEVYMKDFKFNKR